MKCSLLTLSTFIDGELPAERHSEVDAHLVGCPRCSAGAATLREEKERVSRLARVHVDPASAQSMLAQVGISLDSMGPPSSMPAPSPPSPPANPLPWHSSGSSSSSSALPWTPRRPVPSPHATEEMTVATASADLQPDLPLDGVRSSPPSWNATAASRDSQASLDAEAAGMPRGAADDVLRAEGMAPQNDWLEAPALSESWESDLPEPVATSTHEAERWDVQRAPVAPAQPPPPPPPPAVPFYAPAPTRLASASGAAGLFTRVRDVVAVRLALKRGADAVEDSVQIVSGAPTRRGTQLTPMAVASMPDVAARPADLAPTASVAAPAEDEKEVELSGIGHRSSVPVSAGRTVSGDVLDGVADRRPARWRRGHDDDDRAAPADPSAWNAFAASSYPLEEGALDRPPAVPPRRLGRHSRAVARENLPLSTRVGRAVTRMAATARVQTKAAVATTRHGLSGLAKAGPDSRILAGVAGLGLIFVIALLIGHVSKPPAATTAARPAPTAAVTRPQQSAPAQSSSAAAQSSGPSATAAQTFGSGATGFQVIRLRYGAQTSYLRVVFDLGAVSGNAGGSPKVVVSFTGPKSMLVTFNGTLPAGSTGVPLAGKVISSVTLVSSGSQRAEYRFELTRPVTTTGFYLASPTRFVLDLH
ncbi:MAG TPA: zf-HC2 domain-containing protein [Candidatus Dormibacteraeota bacterium]